MQLGVSIGLNDTADDLYALAAAHPAKVTHRPVFQENNAEAALSLLIKAKFLPACLCFTNVSNAEALIEQGVQVIDEETVAGFDTAKTNTLRRKSEAPIPVRGGINTRMVVFEYATGENEPVQRVMFLARKNVIVVTSCASPLKSFTRWVAVLFYTSIKKVAALA